MLSVTNFVLCATCLVLFHLDIGLSQESCIDKSDTRGLQYNGTLAQTKTGLPCQSWDSVASHGDAAAWAENVSFQHNYCRNPNGRKGGPWCYTTDDRYKWQFCKVETCAGTCGVQDIEPTFVNQAFSVMQGRLLQKKRSKRILGGDQAQRGSWPWMVRLAIGDTICGGVVISESSVLTAAHCLDNKILPSRVLAVAGFHGGLEPQIQLRFAKRYFLHEKFHSVKLQNDIALIRLKRPFKMTKHVHSVCLPPPGYIVPPKTYCVVAGTGSTNGHKDSEHLKQVVLPVHSYEECLNHLGSDMEDRTQMCAGWRRRGHDTCAGDSGGPLLCLLNGRWMVQGLTSWSYDDPCAKGKGFWGSYTRVSKYIGWIKRTEVRADAKAARARKLRPAKSHLKRKPRTIY